MSYNGSGTFNINTAGQPVVTGTVISSTAFNALTADLGTGLSTAITKNGQTTVTANIPFNGYKLTGIAVATASGDALSYGQAATVSALTDSALTSGRVPYASTAGLFVDSANLTFNGTTLTANTIGAFTLGGTVAGGGNQINNVVIGTTTPLAGSFTTLSATGTITPSIDIQFGAGGTSFYNNQILRHTNNILYIQGGTSGIQLNRDSSRLDTIDIGSTANQIDVQTNGVTRTRTTNTGLAVTGALSATGLITSTNNTGGFVANRSAVTDYTGTSYQTASVKKWFLGMRENLSSNNLIVYDEVSAVDRLTISTTGLAVTGTLSATGTLSGGTSGTGYSFSGSAPATSLTLDSSGNLGLGVTPSAWISSALQIKQGALFARTYSTSNAQVVLSNNAYVAADTSFKYTQTGPTTAFIQNNGNGFFWNYAASGSADATVSYTSIMTLDTGGNLLVGTTTAGYANSNSMALLASSGYGIVNHPSGSSSGSSYMAFGYNASPIGSISQSGTTAVLYNVTSDQRLKENIQDADSASSLIDSLQVRQFDWKSDNTHQRYGFVAQELVTVAPEAVHQPTNPEEMMAVDYSKLVPMLVKEIQSLRARVAQLETKGV